MDEARRMNSLSENRPMLQMPQGLHAGRGISNSLAVILTVILSNCTAISDAVPSPRQTSTLELVARPSASGPASVSRTATREPSPDRTETPGPLGPVPTVDRSSTYSLTSPDPGLIPALLKAALHQLDETSWLHGPASYDALAFADAIAVIRTLVFDVNQLFPQGLPGIEDLLHFENPDIGAPAPFRDLLADAVVAYLNENSISLAVGSSIEGAEFDAEVLKIELDHDADPEWLLTVNFQSLDSLWIPLDQPGDGGYSRLETDIQAYGLPIASHQLQFLGDLTGDGLTDIILVLDVPYTMGMQWLEFVVAEGTPQGFRPLSDLDHTVNVPKNEVNFELHTHGARTLPTLDVKTTTSGDWNCTYESTVEYSWVGGIQEVHSSEGLVPDTLQCLIDQGMHEDDPVEAAKFFGLALAKLVNEGDSSIEVELFIRFQLALLSSLADDNDNARTHIAAMIELSQNTTSAFATALAIELQPVLQEDRILPFNLCSKASSLYRGVNAPARGWPARHFYSGQDEGYPKRLCNLESVAMQTLTRVVFRADRSPRADLLREGLDAPVVLSFPSVSGFSALWIAAVAVPYTPRGIGVISPDLTSYIIVAQSEDIGWETVGWISGTSGPLLSIDSDLTGDGIPELAIAAPLDQAWLCGDDTPSSYRLFAMSSVGEDWVLYLSDDVCEGEGLEFDLASIFSDPDGDGLSDWFIKTAVNPNWTDSALTPDDFDLELLYDESPDVPMQDAYTTLSQLASRSNLLFQLDRLFFDGAYDTFREQAANIIGAWEMSSLHMAQIDGHLAYLMAIAYEQNGDDQGAVRLLVDTCTLRPVTLWTYLACGRIAQE